MDCPVPVNEKRKKKVFVHAIEEEEEAAVVERKSRTFVVLVLSVLECLSLCYIFVTPQKHLRQRHIRTHTTHTHAPTIVSTQYIRQAA